MTNPSSSKSTSDARADLDAVKADMAELKSDMKSFLSSLMDEGKSSAASAKSSLEQKLDETETAVRQNISTNPLASVAIAAGVGVLVGLFLKKD